MKNGMILAALSMTLSLAGVASAHAKAGGDASHAPASKTMTVKRLVLAHGVDGREPQDPASTFSARNDRVYAFVELDNPAKSSDMITVTFEPPAGPALAEIPLRIGETPRFRTWAFTRKVHEAGTWGVTVRDGRGKVLGHQTFTVEK